MKIFISADMEGATGVTAAEQCDSSRPEYSLGRAMQLHDVLAAIRGARGGRRFRFFGEKPTDMRRYVSAILDLAGTAKF